MPNKGPYDKEYEDMPSPGEGMAFSAFPFDQKYMDDPAWYDQLGRSLIEQRRIFTRPRSNEEQVEMVKKALEDAEDSAREMDEEADLDVDQDEIDERQKKRLWSVCHEAGIKGSASVTQYLVREKGMNAKLAPRHKLGIDVGFIHACKHGFLEIAKILVDEGGADINEHDKDDPDDGQTPLAVAASRGQVDVVVWLLEQGAEYSINEVIQRTIFWAAALSENPEIMKIMLETARQREPQKPQSEFLKDHILGTAAQSTSLEMFKLIIERGGYGKAAENSEQQRRDAILAIPMSIRNDNTNMVCLDTAIDCALPRDEAGAFVRLDDDLVIDNLSAAVANCTVRVKLDELKKLLQLILDATTLTRDSDRFSRVVDKTMHMCYDPKTEPCARELLENWGANPNTNDANDKRDPFPLPLAPGAVSRDNLQWVKFWLDHGADIHRAHGQYCNGPTALALAVTTRRGESNDIVRELLNRGGPVDRMDDDLVDKTELRVVAYGSELNSVELTTRAVEEAEGSEKCEVTVVEFPDGITEAWVKNIQYRHPDTELAQDGTGRPRKGRHT